MDFSLTFKRSILRDLKRLQRMDAKRILDVIEKELIKDPESHPLLKGKFPGLRKFRKGDYRVIYAIVATEVRILRIAHRPDVYKREA